MMPANTHCVELYTRDQCGYPDSWIFGYSDIQGFWAAKYPDTEKSYQGLMTWGFNVWYQQTPMNQINRWQKEDKQIIDYEAALP